MDKIFNYVYTLSDHSSNVEASNIILLEFLHFMHTFLILLNYFTEKSVLYNLDFLSHTVY